jgi:flavin reductase (DIM6/NTAB) family NADH-FMN oxidoreductase RutF
MSGVDHAAFRRAAGQFASGIVVATTSLEGISHAMTVTAFTAVSLEPLLILMCAEKIARFHDAVLTAGTWAISVLGEDGEKTATWLATRGRPLEGQLDAIRHHAGPVTGAAPPRSTTPATTASWSARWSVSPSPGPAAAR